MKNKSSVPIILITKWISTFGVYLQSASLPVIIFSISGSATLLSWTFFAETLPWLIVTPFITDIFIRKFSAKHAYILCNVMRGLLTLLLAVSIHKSLYVIIIFFFLGIFNSLTASIYSMLIKKNTNDGNLSSVLGFSMGVDDLVSIFAPILVSYIISIGRNGVGFLYANAAIQAATGILGVLIVGGNWSANGEKERSTVKGSFYRIKEDFGALKQSGISYLVVSETCRSFVEGMCIPLFIVYVVSIMGAREEVFTIGETVVAVAQVAMSFGYIYLKKRTSCNSIINIGTVLMASTFILMTVLEVSSAYLVAMLFLGLGMAVRQLVAENALISSFAEQRVSGMVSVYNAVVATAYLLGYLFSAFQSYIAPVKVYIIVGILVLLVPLIMTKGGKNCERISRTGIDI